LAFTWIRIILRCWQTGKPYNESSDLKAIEYRSEPFLGNGIQRIIDPAF